MLKCHIVNILLVCFLFQLALSQADEDIVTKGSIKDFPTDYNHTIYAGYFNISSFNKSLYYFFFESQSGHNDDPVILWLNGGPGCSSLMGMTSENGPFAFERNSTKMKINPYSWNKKAHVLYLQSPAGVGFSQGNEAAMTSNDTSVARDNLMAMVEFYKRYSALKTNDLYLTGESYAGIYIPRLAEEILLRNQRQEYEKINLKGILLGNACTHPTQCYTADISRYQVEFLYTRGFLDDVYYSLYNSQCQKDESSDACKAVQTIIYKKFTDTGANIYNIYDTCFTHEKKIKNLRHSLKCTDSLGSIYLFNKNENRPGLHVGELNDTLEWTPCSDKIHYTSESKASYSTIPVLMKAGLKIFYYSGDVDAMVPIQGTISWFQRYRKDFGISVKKNWRPWLTPDKQFAGMVWQLEGLTFISVSGSGHMVPGDKGMAAEQILDVFLGFSSWIEPMNEKGMELQ